MEESPLKKIKAEEEKKVPSIHDGLKNLSNFKVQKVLGESSQRKTITLQGTFEGEDGIGIILLEKKSFSRDSIDNFFCEEAVVKKEFSNDIYGNYEALPPKEFNEVKATIIHPATEKHLQKYQAQKCYLVQETPELYTSICLPHLLEEQINIKWVLNILEHKAEADRIVFEDIDPETGFVLVPDLKWDGEAKESLYLVGIVHKLGVRSLRDLTAQHLPMLQNLLRKGTQAIEERYGMGETQLRVYLHYRPTFYHLHVHFVALQYDAPGTHVEKAHMLATVINNIELVSDYYQRASLPLVVRETETLFPKLEAHESECRHRERAQAIAANVSSIVIELRPRLRACQFHLKFHTPLLQTALESLQVSISPPHSVMLTSPHHSFSISLDTTQLMPDTISCLLKDPSSLSFRVQTSPESNISGSFSAEVLLPSLETTHSSSSSSSKTCVLPVVGDNHDVVCRQCGARAGRDLVFERVLPLPSSSWNEVEFFCHKHEGDDTPSSSPLAPRPSDCFYTTGSWLLHTPTSLTLVYTHPDSGAISCCGCEVQLGVSKDNTATLWNFAVKWRSDSGVMPEDSLTVVEAMERDFKLLVQEATSHAASAKVLLTSNASTVSSPSASPLLLWVLNSPLQVSVLWPSPSSGATRELRLPAARPALKVLYKDAEMEADEAQLVCVPPPMLAQATSLLFDVNQLIPHQFNSSDGFAIAFIYL